MGNNMFDKCAADWPSIGNWDVAVVGAGPAGIAAAISAARSGAEVLLVENYGFPGGTATAACVPNLMGFNYKGRQIVGGIGDEFIRNLASIGEAAFKVGPEALPDPEPIGSRPVNSAVTTTVHGIRVTANRMLKEAGVAPLYYTRMLGGLADEGRVSALVLDLAQGPALANVKTVVDASGDAHLLYRIGAQTRKCPPEVAMTKSMIFQMANVRDFDRRTATARFKEVFEQGRNPVKTQNIFIGYGELHEGAVGLNYTETAGEALQSGELTRMDMELREQISTAAEWLRENFQGFENAYIKETPAMAGIRAGRVSVCSGTITRHDIDENTPVEKPIGLGIRRYGDHGLKTFRSPQNASYNSPRAIPMEALLPVGLDNAVVAGRCIGVEPEVITSIRYMGQCFATGQAAGIIASLGAGEDTSIHDIAYEDIRERLIRQDAILQ